MKSFCLNRDVNLILFRNVTITRRESIQTVPEKADRSQPVCQRVPTKNIKATRFKRTCTLVCMVFSLVL